MADLIELVVKDSGEVPVPGALVYVYADGVLASLTDALGAPIANPMVADAFGYVKGYVSYVSQYSYKITWGGRERYVATFKEGEADTTLRTELAASTGAGTVGAGDGASGSLWTTVQGFINKLLSSAGSSVIGFIQSGTDAVARTVQDKLRETITSSDFTSLDAAIQAWAATGGRLVINHDYDITSAIFANLTSGNSYVLDCDRPRKIRFTGAHAAWAIRLYNGGTVPAPLIVSPNLTIDGLQNVNCCLFVDFGAVTDSTKFADCQIGGTYLNTRMTVAVDYPDSAPVIASGGFDRLIFEKITAKNATREATAGIPGSRGSIGIGSNNWARYVRVSDFHIENIDTEDAQGSADRVDCDGILLFCIGQQQGTSNLSGPIIERGKLINCAGRGVKRFALMGGGVTRDITVIRSVTDTPGSVDIDHQDGGGRIENINIKLTGNANLSSTTAISVGTGYARPSGYEFEPIIVSGVRITDTTGTAKKQIVGLQCTQGDGARRVIELSNIVDTGTSEVFSYISALGYTGKARIEMKGIDCSLVKAMFKTDDNVSAGLRVTAHDVTNRNGTLPVMVGLTDVMRTSGYGRWKGNGTVLGFTRYTGAWRGAPNFKCGFYGPGGGVEADPPEGVEEFSGPVRMRVTLAAGVTYSGPPCGLYQNIGGNYEFQIKRHDNNGYGLWTTGASSTTLTQIIAPPGNIVATSGGTFAGAVALEVIKDSTTQELRIKNGEAGTINFDLVLNP